MVGILVSLWGGLFSGATLVSGSVAFVSLKIHRIPGFQDSLDLDPTFCEKNLPSNEILACRPPFQSVHGRARAITASCYVEDALNIFDLAAEQMIQESYVQHTPFFAHPFGNQSPETPTMKGVPLIYSLQPVGKRLLGVCSKGALVHNLRICLSASGI